MGGKKKIPLKERIILALDVEDAAKARELVRATEAHLGFYKVGLELFLAGGFEMVHWIADRGHKVMLDLKFFDIPETVKRAVARVAEHPVTFATVHGIDSVVRAAVESRGTVKILAVTVLTSMGPEDLKAMGVSSTVEEAVLDRASRAVQFGSNGVVASALEAPMIRKALGDEPILVTPGIRPGGSLLGRGDDQSRVITPGRAVASGADYLVVGRPITRSPDPLSVIESMQQEIAQAAS